MEPETFVQRSLADFLDRVGSDQPTPGGGSVAALTGALAASLGRKVTALTLGKPAFAAVESQVQTIANRLLRAQQALCALIDEDAAAYGQLHAALRLHRADPQRAEQVAGAARLAASVPLETATLAAAVLVDLSRLRDIGNPRLRSDVDAARHLAHAALQAAAANVRANLPLMSAENQRLVAEQLDRLVAGSEPSGDPPTGR